MPSFRAFLFSVSCNTFTWYARISLCSAGIIGGVGYGGKDSFWENAGGSAGGDLTQIAFLAVIFPIAVTAFFFINNDD